MVPLSLLPDAAAVFPMKRSQLFQCGLADGQIGADQFIRELDRIIQMMQMENY